MAPVEQIKILTPEEMIKREVGKTKLDAALVVAIARCESGLTQMDPKTGEVLHGIVNKKDIGLFQINTYWHQKEAERLKMNIFDIEGNIKYAVHLLESEGTVPWKASENCWRSNNEQ